MAEKDWKENEKEFLVTNYASLSNKEIGDALGRTKASIRQMINKINAAIEDPEKRYYRTPEQNESIRSRIAGNRFEKGIKPWNAGTRGIKKANSGSFKAGNRRMPTILYDNAITFKKDKKTGKTYKMKRVALNEWEYLQRFNWVKHFGPIPEGYIVGFRNGDSLNCEPDNLILLTEDQHMKRCSAKQKMKYKEKRETRERLKQMEVEMKQMNVGVKKHAPKKVKLPVNSNTDIPIRIDSKTVIFAKAGQDVNQVRQAYLLRMQGAQ